jgi:D-alanyl-D-alanine carboxypeptidase (penicillin-binding protein 5/6)
MPSSFLAFLFAAVMVGLTWMNHVREMPLPPEKTAAVEIITEPVISPLPSPSLSPSPEINSLVVPKPSPADKSGSSLGGDNVKRIEILPPQLTARAYILTDETGAVLIGQNTGVSMRVASLTKLMTALIFTELFGQDEKLKITEHALALNANNYGLAAGDMLTKQEALEFMLIVSSNAVAESAAEALGGEEFIAKMNAKAAALGMNDTYFVDASGLKDFSRSSPRDIAKLLRYIASNHPEILVISRTPTSTFRTHTLVNTNELLGRVAGIIGGKTGYTDAAGQCLAVVFEWRGRRYFAVVLGSRDRAADMRALIEYAWNIP